MCLRDEYVVGLCSLRWMWCVAGSVVGLYFFLYDAVIMGGLQCGLCTVWLVILWCWLIVGFGLCLLVLVQRDGFGRACGDS